MVKHAKIYKKLSPSILRVNLMWKYPHNSVHFAKNLLKLALQCFGNSVFYVLGISILKKKLTHLNHLRYLVRENIKQLDLWGNPWSFFILGKLCKSLKERDAWTKLGWFSNWFCMNKRYFIKLIYYHLKTPWQLYSPQESFPF